MNTQNSDPSDLLKPLRGMYLAQLRERAESVSGFLERARAGGLPASEIDLMRAVTHKLAGSGSTYGYPLITQAARAFEEALQAVEPDPAAWILMAQSLLHTCEQALLAVERDSTDGALRSPDVVASAIAGPSPSEPQTGAGRTVLVADDDPAIRELLAYKFRLRGARVLLADNGEEALRLIAGERPDLAILDRKMPGLDGLDVLRKMREAPETRAIPVIFLTAMRQEKDILDGFRQGVSDYVLKPFLPEEVLARSFRLLGA